MSQVTEQSVRFQTALASIKLIQASAVLDLTEDDFDFLTSNKVWIATDQRRRVVTQLGKLDYDATPFNQILKQNAKREMRLRLGKVTVADVLAAQPVTTNLLKFMRASIKMIGVSNLQSFIASMTQKLTLSDISDESKNYLDKAGITTACLRIKSKWTAGGK